jgi:hypothetical protein
VAHNSGAGLTVAAVDAQRTGADEDEIHVIYVNVDLNLEIIILKNGTWGHCLFPLPQFQRHKNIDAGTR